MNRRLLLLVISTVCAIGAACSSSTSTGAPSLPAIDITGTWSGPTTFDGQSSKMVWTLVEQPGGAVTGSMFDALPSGTVLINGSLTGTVNGSTLTYAIAIGAGAIPSLPTCTGQLTGSMQISIGTPSTLAGSFTVAASSCPSPLAGGPLTLTR